MKNFKIEIKSKEYSINVWNDINEFFKDNPLSISINEDDENDEKQDVTDQIKEQIKDDGCWGFTNRTDEICLLIKENCSEEDILEVLGHEIGHCIKPHYKNFMREENKADSFGYVTKLSFQLMKQILK